jgi:glycerophosphoryl diester phosphodiesterase
MLKMPKGLPLPHKQIIGHRGVAGLAPENTLASFSMAAEMGLNWVEFDTHRCLSGEWIVIHDETLQRTTNGTGLIAETAYAELKRFDAGNWFSPQFKNVQIPSLKETLVHLQNLGLHPNIEIKQQSLNKEQDCKHFIQFLQGVWSINMPLPLVSSFDLETLILLRRHWINLPLGYLVEQFNDATLEEAIKYGLTTVHCNHELLDLTFLRKVTLQKNTIPILAYTVNNRKRIEMLLEAGVSCVFSDLTHDVAELWSI